jgi:preprotein translocase subunit SecE
MLDAHCIMATRPDVFVKQVLDELKKVKWSTRNEIIRLTAVVIIISAIVGFFLGGLDFVFTKVVEFIIKR